MSTLLLIQPYICQM